MAITMTFVSVVLLVLVNLQSFSKQVEDSVEIQVFLVSTTQPEELPTIENQFKVLENVESVTFVSRDAALKQLIQEYGSAFDLFEGDTNPLYDKFEVQVKEKAAIKQTAKALEAFPAVFQARYGSDTAEALLTSLGIVRFGLLLTIVSLAVTMIVLFFTLMMSIRSRQREIQTRMLIGATPSYIRRPFIVQSVLLTVAGGLLALLVSLSGYGLFFSRFQGGVEASGYALSTLLQAGVPVAGIILTVSLLFGWLSAVIAVASSIEYPK